MGYHETKLTKEVRQWWNKRGSLPMKFHGNEFTRMGAPDLWIIFEGRLVAIELKQGKNKPRPIQLAFIEMLKKDYDSIAFWANETDWKVQSIKAYDTIKKDKEEKECQQNKTLKT